MNGQLALLKTSYSLQDFIAVHYGQSSFNGHVVIGARKKNCNSIYRFRSIAVHDLQESIGTLNFKNMDYYITANSYAGLDRNKENLFALENIVIDIDHHEGNVSSILHHNRMESLLSRIRMQMPEHLPNTVVKTGRGLQLWYSIKPAHKSLAYLYTEYVDMLISEINNIILKDRELYDYFGCVDAAPSRNMAGYFRLPGTYNTNTGYRGTFEIWHEERTDIACVPVEKKEIRKEHSAEILVLPKNRDSYLFARKRLQQMEKLRNIRNDQKMPEQRDLMNLIVYCSCAAAYDQEELHKIVRKFNSGHKNPLSERELWQQLSTAEKKKYKLSNKWIIKSLHITAEEQEQIGIREMGSISNRELDRKEARIRKKERNEKIISLALEGHTYKEISNLVNCSEKTVGRVVKSAGAKKSWSDLHAQILGLLSDGYVKEEVAELLGICVRTVERHLYTENENTAEIKENQNLKEYTKEKNNDITQTENVILFQEVNAQYVQKEENDRKDKSALIYFFSIGDSG